VAIGGILGAFRGKPARPTGPGGQMALADHFRELRARLLRATVALVVATVISFYFYDELIALIKGPYDDAVAMLNEQDASNTEIFVSGIGGGLMIQLKLCALSGVIASSPVWLYQIWAFLVPGLKRSERRWTMVFVLIAGPLFGAGVALGYYVLPKGIQVLIQFTPDNMQNLNDFNDFFSFTTRMLLVFGIALEIPFFVVLLNLAGVISGKALGRHRPWIVLGTFVFAAVATPSTDPFAMLVLALTMLPLFLLAEAIARIVDRRRGRGRESVSTDAWGDDTASPL